MHDTPLAMARFFCRWYDCNGKYTASKFNQIRAIQPGMNGEIARYLLQRQIDVPTAFDHKATQMTPTDEDGVPHCARCGDSFHIFNHHFTYCGKTSGSKSRAKYDKHQKLQREIVSISRAIGINASEGRSGGGPVVLDETFEKPKNLRTDIAFAIPVEDKAGLMTDVTVVGCQPSGDRAFYSALRGMEDPYFFVNEADKAKERKYATACANAGPGYAFIPCAISTGGRPGRGALKLFRTLRRAAGKSCEDWFFYNCLVPRVFATQAVAQYYEAKAVFEEHTRLCPDIPHHCESEYNPTPEPADVDQPYVGVSTCECDERWGPTSNGRCDFVPSRCKEFEIHLRTCAPDFFDNFESATAAGG